MIASIVAIAAYILGSLGFYTIASRRGIKHAWLAWVPIANAWLLGCISDQYQSVVFEKQKNKRISLLVLNIVNGLCVAVMVVLCITMIVQMIVADGGLHLNEEFGEGVYDDAYVEMEPDDFYETEEEMPEELIGTLIGLLAAYVVMILVFLPMTILRYVALYDVFRSCDPGSSVLFLLLSIFLGISSFLVFACRERDLGMPSREEPPIIYSAYHPTCGAFGESGCSEPPQPVMPEREPWEQAGESF